MEFTCFTGVDFAEGEEGDFIYQIITEHGDGWEEMTSNEKGNYDFLMYNDIDHQKSSCKRRAQLLGKMVL